MRVLLVDTDAQAVAVIQRALKSSGALLEHVETGEEAYQLAKRYDYDALIMDLMLPDTDGYEVIRRLRWASISVPILVLSSLTRPQAKVKAFSLGADDFLARPFDEAELGARVQALVRRSKGLSHSRISRGPIVLDMGTSAFMMTDVLMRERLGQPLPEGVAIGPDGEPTTDAALARRGALLPFGDYKGFGLALMVQALGVLAGSASEDGGGDYGYLFIAFRPDLLGPADVFENRVTELIDRVKATPRRPGVDDIRIPSERAFRTREHALRDGIAIDRRVFDALVEWRRRAN